jgi:hypothetical protein
LNGVSHSGSLFSFQRANSARLIIYTLKPLSRENFFTCISLPRSGKCLFNRSPFPCQAPLSIFFHLGAATGPLTTFL